MDKPMRWPIWLDEIWAKSPVGTEESGESLAEHVWQVLQRLADLYAMRPGLDEQILQERLWHKLFWACMLHDLGKCATGFQDKLHGRRNTEQAAAWGAHRHEVISLAFVDWVFPIQDDIRLWVVAGIVAHHRDNDEIKTLYPPQNDIDVDQIIAAIPPSTIAGIHRWLSQCASSWVSALNLPEVDTALAVKDEKSAVEHFFIQPALRVRAALTEYHRWVRQLDRSPSATPAELLLRGLVTQSDHTASAHAGHIKAFISSGVELKHKWTRIKQYSTHQNLAADTKDTALLIAPTGSGKTEAALLWASNQTGAPRLFYTLPYQASMNAMYVRLENTYGMGSVGLQHGRGLLALYRLISESEPDPAKATRQARWRKNMAGLHHFPVQIFSPYQMLKAAYRLKGYESMLADFQNAAFIFDEIHAYEPARLALIIEMLRYLRDHHAARFFIMSATFPTLICAKLNDALGTPVTIHADAQLYQDYCRHLLQVCAGDMFDALNWERVVNTARQGKSVLICCNTVRRAQQAQKQIREALPEAEVVLLHGRLIARDRLRREGIVRSATGSTSDTRRQIILVATQVVEVSLDIDLDTIFTDPAPLEALIQRFGRINRRRLQTTLAPVFVHNQPADGQYIYDPALIEATLGILTRENNRPIREDLVGVWLDEIYQGDVRTKWLHEYDHAAREFTDTCIANLRPFNSDTSKENAFYKAFDGVEVLPLRFADEYLGLKESDPVLAQELFVSIRYGQYAQLLKANRVRSTQYPIIIDAPYYDGDQGIGLDLSAQRD